MDDRYYTGMVCLDDDFPKSLLGDQYLGDDPIMESISSQPTYSQTSELIISLPMSYNNQNRFNDISYDLVLPNNVLQFDNTDIFQTINEDFGNRICTDVQLNSTKNNPVESFDSNVLQHHYYNAQQQPVKNAVVKNEPTGSSVSMNSDFVGDLENINSINRSLKVLTEDSDPSIPKCCLKHYKYFKKVSKKATAKNCAAVETDVQYFRPIALFVPGDERFIKPKYSHSILCAFAIWSHPQKLMEVSDIYDFVRSAQFHWKNSLRHSLATCNWFVKSNTHRTAKKGYKWTLNPMYLKCLQCEIRKQCIKDARQLYACMGSVDACYKLQAMGLLDIDMWIIEKIRDYEIGAEKVEKEAKRKRERKILTF